MRRKSIPLILCSFFSNRSEFQSEMLPTYLIIQCACSSIIINQLAYCILQLSDLQWYHLVILACSKTFLEKRVFQNCVQTWLWNNCLDFITKEIWRLKSPELNSLDHYVWENVLGQSLVSSKIKDIAELNAAMSNSVYDRQSYKITF